MGERPAEDRVVAGSNPALGTSIDFWNKPETLLLPLPEERALYVGKGNYTIKVEADIVPGETDTADNTYIDGWVIISMVGDITGPDGWPDGICDMRDVSLVARNFGQTVPPGPPNCDMTGPTPGVPDGFIDMRDISLVARNFGQTDP